MRRSYTYTCCTVQLWAQIYCMPLIQENLSKYWVGVFSKAHLILVFPKTPLESATWLAMCWATWHHVCLQNLENWPALVLQMQPLWHVLCKTCNLTTSQRVIPFKVSQGFGVSFLCPHFIVDILMKRFQDGTMTSVFPRAVMDQLAWRPRVSLLIIFNVIFNHRCSQCHFQPSLFSI